MTMIDVLLVHPAATHGIYGQLGDTLTACEPPLWPRLIAGYLHDRGWRVAICDMEAERITAEEVAARGTEARIVAICCYGHQPSASTQQMVGARAVATAIKSLAQDREGILPTVVMLGNHPSALPERTLREEPVDFVIDGEGPATLDKLLRLGVPPPRSTPEFGSYVFQLGEIPGLVWRSVEIICNPLPPLLDLDKDLHGRAWDLLPPLLSYRAHNWQCLDGWPRSPYAAIYTSLGCSYKCHFCMVNIFQHTNRYRRRSPAEVIKEVLYLYEEHDVRTFKIIDELFVLNRAHVREICEGIVALGIGDLINIWAYARTDTVDPDDLRLMRAAGIRWLALGIESGSVGVRVDNNKGLHGEAKDQSLGNMGIMLLVRAIQVAGINVIGNYIFGLPGDTQDSMQATLDLALKLNTEWANFYCAMAYPGSPLYERTVAERPQDLPPSWAAYSQHNRHTHPLRNAHLSAADVLRFRDDAFNQYFFNNPPFHALLRRKFGQRALDEIERMRAYGSLPRDLLT